MSYTQMFLDLWLNLFGRTEWLGINMGFWFGFGVVLLFVVLENLIFWSMRPKHKTPGKKAEV